MLQLTQDFHFPEKIRTQPRNPSVISFPNILLGGKTENDIQHIKIPSFILLYQQRASRSMIFLTYQQKRKDP